MPNSKLDKFIQDNRDNHREMSEKKEEEKKIPPELKAYQQKAEEFTERYDPLFSTFSKDISLKFQPSLEAETFSISPKEGVITLATKWFAEKECSQDQLIWACFHELGHFADLKSDPEGFLKNFDYINQKGQFAEAYGIFYNVFDDIFANQKVANRAPLFSQKAEGEKEVQNLYRNKLFTKTDYTDLPRHLQFLYKLLREKMVPGEKVRVTPEVEEILNNGVEVMGQKMSFDEFIDTFITPTGGTFEKEKNFPSFRYKILRNYVEPIYQKLLEEDLQDNSGQPPQGEGPRIEDGPQGGEPQPPEKEGPQGGEPQPPGKEGPERPQSPSRKRTPFDDYYKEFEKNNPPQIPPQQIKDWIREEKKKEEEKKAAEKKKKEEEQKSAEEKAEEAQSRADEHFAQEHNIPLETMRRFRRYEKKVAPYLEELSRLWRSIVYGKSEEVEIALDGFYKYGTDIDIPQVIKEWPKIETGRLEETRIFVKPVEKLTMRERPELIEVSLICDLSGSMDSYKREVLKQTTVLLLCSLGEFQTYLNLTRNITKSKLNVDTEVWGFGTDALRLKSFRAEKNNSYDEDRVEIIKIVDILDIALGSTFDHRPLSAIAKTIESNPSKLESIKKGKTLKIIFEITDGGSSDPYRTKNALSRLTKFEENGEGIITRAIQIKPGSEEEKEIFKDVWGERGYLLGDKIEDLPKAVATLLAKYLGSIKL